MLTDFILNQ